MIPSCICGKPHTVLGNKFWGLTVWPQSDQTVLINALQIPSKFYIFSLVHTSILTSNLCEKGNSCAQMWYYNTFTMRHHLCVSTEEPVVERVPTPDTRVDTTWRITLLVSVTLHHRHCRVFVMYCELSPQKNLHLLASTRSFQTWDNSSCTCCRMSLELFMHM